MPNNSTIEFVRNRLIAIRDALSADPVKPAFDDAFAAKAAIKPKRKRGRPRKDKLDAATANRLRQTYGLSTRKAATHLDPRPHNNEARRKWVARARERYASDADTLEPIIDARFATFAKRTHLPPFIAAFLLDDAGELRPREATLLHIDEMLRNLDEQAANGR